MSDRKNYKKHFKSKFEIFLFALGIIILILGISFLIYIICSTPFSFEFDSEKQSFLNELFAAWGWLLIPLVYIVAYLGGPLIGLLGIHFISAFKPRTDLEWEKVEKEREEAHNREIKEKEEINKKMRNPHRCETCYYYRRKGVFGHYCEYMSEGYTNYSVDDDGKINKDYEYTSRPNVSSYGTCSHWISNNPYDRNDYHY